MELSENIYSHVHRLLLGKNADGENERIEIHLLEKKQATFHLHVSMIAEEKKTFSADVLMLNWEQMLWVFKFYCAA